MAIFEDAICKKCNNYRIRKHTTCPKCGMGASEVKCGCTVVIECNWCKS